MYVTPLIELQYNIYKVCNQRFFVRYMFKWLKLVFSSTFVCIIRCVPERRVQLFLDNKVFSKFVQTGFIGIKPKLMLYS